MTKFPIPDAALDDRLAILGTAGSGIAVPGLIRDRSELAEPSHLDCAYAAGFFDGEGTVSIARTFRSDCVDPAFVLTASAAQVALEPLLFLQNRWGGSICRRPAKPPRQEYFNWQCHANVAAEFLLDLLPYLILKRERAILGIRFQDEKAGQGRNRGDRGRALVFEQFYRELRAMNGSRPNDWAREVLG
jgi:hypothetical protein